MVKKSNKKSRLSQKALNKPKLKGYKVSAKKKMTEGKGYTFLSSGEEKDKSKSMFFNRSYDTEKEAEKKWL